MVAQKESLKSGRSFFRGRGGLLQVVDLWEGCLDLVNLGRRKGHLCSPVCGKPY